MDCAVCVAGRQRNAGGEIEVPAPRGQDRGRGDPRKARRISSRSLPQASLSVGRVVRFAAASSRSAAASEGVVTNTDSVARGKQTAQERYPVGVDAGKSANQTINKRRSQHGVRCIFED